MDGIKEDHEDILRKFIDEIKNFDLFIEIWNSTVTFLRDEADYVNKVFRLNQCVFKFTQEPCCLIFFSTNMVRKTFMITLEQLVSIDYDEEAISFRNDRLKIFYAEKFGLLVKDIIDLSIELSFRNEFNSKLSLWGKKNLEHGLSLIRYILKSVGSKTLFTIGLKHHHFEFLINAYSKHNTLLKILEAFISNCNRTDEDLNYQIDNISYLNSLETIYLIMLKIFSTGKFYNFNVEVHNYNISIIKNLAEFYDENIKCGKLMCNYSLWNRTLAKIIEFSVQKIYEESEKRYIRLRFSYICYFLQKIKILFKHLNYVKKEKYSEKLIFSMKRVLISIDNSSKFRDLDNDEKETKLNAAAIDCLKLVFKYDNIHLCLFSKNIIEIIKHQMNSNVGNLNLANYSIAVQSVFEYELTKNNQPSNELILIVNKMQKILSKQVLSGNDKKLNEFFKFSKQILLVIKHKNLLIDNEWHSFLFEVFSVFEFLKTKSMNFDNYGNLRQNCFETIKVVINVINRSKIVSLFLYGIYEALNLIEFNMPINCSIDFKMEIFSIIQKVKSLTIK